jgi:hypothetical protein
MTRPLESARLKHRYLEEYKKAEVTPFRLAAAPRRVRRDAPVPERAWHSTSTATPSQELGYDRDAVVDLKVWASVVAGGRVTSFWWAGLRSSP